MHEPSRGLFPHPEQVLSACNIHRVILLLQDNSWSNLQLSQDSNVFSMKTKLHIFTISAVFCDTSTGDAQLSLQHPVQGWRRRGQSILKASRVFLSGPRRAFLSHSPVPAAQDSSCPCTQPAPPVPCTEALFWQLELAFSQHWGSLVTLRARQTVTGFHRNRAGELH